MAWHGVNNSEWREVKFINGYALFMGYLMVGVRGLGLLVITWTTVVLLGGFVSDLEKEDFWCLAGITLIQTAGVFNFLLKDKISDTVHSWWGLFISVFAMLSKDGGIGRKAHIIFYILVAIQVLVFGVILCAIGIVYMLGIYISSGVSLWRLIKHDFGDDEAANKGPALQVLYNLAVTQGVIFGYKTIYALVTESRLANMEARRPMFVDNKGLVEEYIVETVAGCEKNVSFASGRNFVTYGVDLMMEAKSIESFIAGIRVLGGAIKSKSPRGTKVPAKHLLTRSDSSSAIIRRLLETVGPRSPYSREIKKHVVRILDVIAPCIRVEEFPRAIECLCSVVDTSESNQLHHSDDDHKIKDTEETRRYGYKFKDYERAELLEEYEKEYIKCELRITSPDLFLLGTLRDLCQRLILHFLEGKRKEAVENEREEKKITRGFDRLLTKATNIIHKLLANEDDIWIMRTCVSNTMLHKIAKLPTKLHRENHYPCRVDQKSELQMLEQCWAITERLLVALTATSSLPLLPATPVGEGAHRRRRSKEIQDGVEQLLVLGAMDDSVLGSSFKRTIKDSIESNIKSIFDCLDCRATQKKQAIQILLHLSLGMSLDSASSRRRLSWILLLILCTTDDDSKYWMIPGLTDPNNNCCDIVNGIRRLAGEKLSEMLRERHELPSEESARELQSIHLALEDLKCAFNDDAEDISIRTHAIIIMDGLCRLDYTRFSELEGFLVDAFPEVVKETLFRCESITAERPERGTDVEMGDVSQDNQDDTQQLRKALASLCYYGYNNSESHNSTMRSKFREIATKTCEEQGTSFWDFYSLIGKVLNQPL